MKGLRLNPVVKKSDKEPLTIGLVSLSSGLLGEPSSSHQLEIIKKRLTDFGLNYKFMKNSLKGVVFLRDNPKARAEDLIEAFTDNEVDIIWSVIGGNDTYRIIPFLDNNHFKELVHNNPKPFIGFSDTTVNHLFLYKLGLNTIYGPAILTDFGELSDDMLPYTKDEIISLLSGEKNHTIKQSKFWYLDREDFSPSQIGTERTKMSETHGNQFINGKGIIEGELIGGCIESICSLLPSLTNSAPLCGVELAKTILPDSFEWKNKVLFLETSEERPTPQAFSDMLEQISNAGILDEIKALLIGKPIDEAFYDEYFETIKRVSYKCSIPLVYNLNFGHSAPRTFLPYGQTIIIDFGKESLRLPEPIIRFV